MDTALLTTADDGTPRSDRFDDVYFSRDDGLAESRYVFLEHNDLAQRFDALRDHQVFTIAETGFGTGLNCLAAWQLFRARAPESARLVFISTEKFPLSAEDIRASLAHWHELSPLLDRLVERYPHRVPGHHCVELDDRVDLVLLFGDANDTLADLNARVDAWFLDGFAPAKNPDLWQPPLFDAMARLSRPGATAATFTAARRVRDGLSGAGFDVARVKGYGRKRDMVRARFRGLCGPPAPRPTPSPEWAWPRYDGDPSAIVVGAGLAGAHTARELAERGWCVRVIEQGDRPACGASGNAQGAVYARLSHDDSAANRFYTQALTLAQHRLGRLPATVAHRQCGLLQLNQGTKEAKRFDRFRRLTPFPDSLVRRVDAETASTLAGVPLDCEALYFPEGGWVSPADLTAHRLDHPNIEVLTRHRVVHLERRADDWRLTLRGSDGDRSVTAPLVVLTTAWETDALAAAAYLPVNPIAGQVTRVASQAPLSDLKTVLCSDRYLVPAQDGQHSLGATFHLKRREAVTRPEDDADNLAALHRRLPGLVSPRADITDARAGVRCASPDYLPLVGPLLDPDAFTAAYRTALQKRLTHRLAPPPWQPGLWVNIAHGSKGLCSIPLAAKTLAAWLNDEPMLVPQQLANHLNPNRFLIRSMIRGQR